MRNTRLLTSLTMSLGLLAGTACAASADVSGAALGVPETQQDPEQVSLQPGAGGELVTGKGEGKPGGGGNPPSPPPAGKVYVVNSGVTTEMNADGSNQVTYPNVDAQLPSQDTHNAERMFLERMVTDVSQNYPDGGVIRDIYLMDSSGNIVNLTNSDLSLQVQTAYAWSNDADRSLADGRVLFNATVWSGGAAVSAGVYSVDIEFGGSGDMLGAVAGSLTLQVPLALLGDDPDLNLFAPNAAGDEIAYNRLSDNALFTTVFPTGSSSHTSLAATGSEPDFAPDSSLVVYHRSGKLYTLVPGGSESAICGSGSGNKAKVCTKAHFSPDGANLLFLYKNGTATATPARMSNSGSGVTALPGHAALDWTN